MAVAFVALDSVEHASSISDERGGFDPTLADARYGEAFQNWGLNIESLPPEEAERRLYRSTVAVELAAALDHWADIRLRVRGPEDPSWKELLRVARAADPDAWRCQVREALAHRDEKGLETLLKEDATAHLLPTTLHVVSCALRDHPEVGEALLREGQRRYPNDFWLNYNLGVFLKNLRPPKLDEAIRFQTAAVALRPRSPIAHVGLGEYLRTKGRLEEAIAEYREAIRLKKDLAGLHNELGACLNENGQWDEAIAELREALRLDKDSAPTHSNLGLALHNKGRLDEAVAELREAIRLKKDKAEFHYNLGRVLGDQGRTAEAIAAYRESIRLEKIYAETHVNLGKLLQEIGLLDEAITECRAAIRLKEDLAEAHCNLGQFLLMRGEFQAAVAEIRRGHELGSRQPRWRYPSAEWLRNAERLAALDARLPALLKGQEQPKDAGERIALAEICQLHKQCFAASARWYSEAFAQERKLADDLNAEHRYNAACAAALASCGQGKDADKLNTKERAGLRQQALDWLRADLKAYRQLMEKSAGKAGPEIAQQMQHWLQDGDFTGVRGDNALAKLPEEERTAWRKLWAGVAEMLAKAQGKKPTEKKTDTKE